MSALHCLAWLVVQSVSGATQWADPGDTPYELEDGTRYWVTVTGGASHGSRLKWIPGPANVSIFIIIK